MIKAIQPYIYEGLNFKDKAFLGWKEAKYPTTKGFYPRFLHWLLFRRDIFPTLWQGEARLVFVQPVSLYFDAGISVVSHELIPLIWDCWPCYYDKTEQWLKRHHIKTAIFTSKQEKQEIQKRIPHLKTIHCPEAIDTALYHEGKELKFRSIDVFEFGRANNVIGDFAGKNNLTWVNTAKINKRLSNEELSKNLSNAKITICFPKSITHPEIAQGVETLTQRYWEAMVSKSILWGHCPKELSDFIGYNPVVEFKEEKQVLDILSNIEQFQPLVDKNRETALRFGDWKERMKMIHDGICPH
jgi:hypothetical protein